MTPTYFLCVLYLVCLSVRPYAPFVFRVLSDSKTHLTKIISNIKLIFFSKQTGTDTIDVFQLQTNSILYWGLR